MVSVDPYPLTTVSGVSPSTSRRTADGESYLAAGPHLADLGEALGMVLCDQRRIVRGEPQGGHAPLGYERRQPRRVELARGRDYGGSAAQQRHPQLVRRDAEDRRRMNQHPSWAPLSHTDRARA